MVTEFALSIAGHGDFVGIPNNDLNVALLDPSYHLHINAAGLLTSLGDPFFLDSYAAVDPAFDSHQPTPTVFESYLTTISGGAYVIPLAGGRELASKDVGSLPRTAQLVAVTEPATLWLAGGAVAGLGTGLARRIWRYAGCPMQAQRRKAGSLHGERPAFLSCPG